MKWEPYNYTIAFREPYRIQEIGNLIRLPMPVAMVSVGCFFFLLGVVLVFFRGMVQHLAQSLPFMPMLSYFCVPLGGTLLINKVEPDGKKVYFYVWDWLVYLVTIQWRDVVYCDGKVYKRKEVDEEIRFR